MGTNLPRHNSAALTWLEARIDAWTADPISIGLTAAKVASLAAEIAAARSATTAAATAQAQAIDATAELDNLGNGVRASASLLVANIKAFANAAQEPETVYVAASLSPKANASQVPVPELATFTRAALGAAGEITIHFNARGASGTVWQVSRKVDGESNYSPIGFADVATKSYLDTTIPGGAGRVRYRVQGIRGSRAGPMSTQFLVAFGATDRASIAAA